MDFKVAGTRKGITALQMDIKVTGLSRKILQEALAQAHRGRMHILDIMEATLALPRPNISAYAPRIFSIRIPKDKIREVIGPGGKMIRSIIERTGCKIDVDDDGKVDIASTDEASALKGHRDHQGDHRRGGSGKDLPREGDARRRLRAFVEILPASRGCCISPRSPSTGSRRSPTRFTRARRSGEGHRRGWRPHPAEPEGGAS
jgi:polyribonucleotide nucleotidyltransferase